MNEKEYLLTCLAEECAEVAHRVSKILRFGPNETQPGQPLDNKARLAQELNDLMAVKDLLEGANIIPISHIPLRHKQEKIEKYMRYSRELGTLT